MKESVVRVVSRIALNDKGARALRDQVVPSATWKRTKGRLSVHASERAERLARVMATAEYTWDDADQASGLDESAGLRTWRPDTACGCND